MIASFELWQKKEPVKGVPCKGFFETLKKYRKLHFQAVRKGELDKNQVLLYSLLNGRRAIALVRLLF